VPHEINIQSRKRDEMINITGQIQRMIAKENVQDGLVAVTCNTWF
jgi:thiamine phosphate synthase YjbQ (UPF0047 family)